MGLSTIQHGVQLWVQIANLLFVVTELNLNKTSGPPRYINLNRQSMYQFKSSVDTFKGTLSFSNADGLQPKSGYKQGMVFKGVSKNSQGTKGTMALTSRD